MIAFVVPHRGLERQANGWGWGCVCVDRLHPLFYKSVSEIEIDFTFRLEFAETLLKRPGFTRNAFAVIGNIDRLRKHQLSWWAMGFTPQILGEDLKIHLEYMTKNEIIEYTLSLAQLIEEIEP